MEEEVGVWRKMTRKDHSPGPPKLSPDAEKDGGRGMATLQGGADKTHPIRLRKGKAYLTPLADGAAPECRPASSLVSG